MPQLAAILRGMGATDPGSSLVRLAGVEVLAELSDLYAELHEHQARAVADRLGAPARTAAAAWLRRRDRYTAWLMGGDGFVCVAEHERALVGYAFAVVTDGYDGWEAGPLGELRDLVVAKAARGRGVGRALVAAVRDELAVRGASGVRLNVLAGNDDALRFYRRCGFEVTARTLSVRTQSATPP